MKILQTLLIYLIRSIYLTLACQEKQERVLFQVGANYGITDYDGNFKIEALY